MQLVAFLFVASTFSLLIGTSSSEAVTCGKARDGINDGEWPWIAAIYYSFHDYTTFKCGGTLIHSRIVLTSAMCVFEDGRQIMPDRIQVQLEKFNLNETGSTVQEFQAHQIIAHPRFNPSNLANNIAIIRLSNNAILSDRVQPICLSESNKTELTDKLGTVAGWGLKQGTTEHFTDTVKEVLMSLTSNINCLTSKEETVLPDGCYCAGYRDENRFDNADFAASMAFEENGVYSIRGILSKAVPKKNGHNNDQHEYVIFTDVPTFIPWIQEVAPEVNFNRSKRENDTACRLNEEFVIDPFRCDETCEKYGNPICVEYTPEGRCYCKEGFVRLTTVGICVAPDNRACVYKMPPKRETCEQRQNEQLSEWLYDEPCAKTCENHNVPCNKSVPSTGMFWGPHCVCKDGFARLPNGKCVAIDDPKCKELWSPSPKELPCTDFCGQFAGMRPNCPQSYLGMEWSSAVNISGKHCVQVIEVADPHTWTDNYICFNKDYGVRWNSAGKIEGMICTQIIEPADPHTWHDNYLCVPNSSQFRFEWSSNGAISGLCCVQMSEPADPHTWMDNYLCVSAL